MVNAAATIAVMLNVFLLFALPVDALKIPKVAMVQSPTHNTWGGTGGFSEAFISPCLRYLSSSLSLKALLHSMPTSKELAADSSFSLLLFLPLAIASFNLISTL